MPKHLRDPSYGIPFSANYLKHLFSQSINMHSVHYRLFGNDALYYIILLASAWCHCRHCQHHATHQIMGKHGIINKTKIHNVLYQTTTSYSHSGPAQKIWQSLAHCFWDMWADRERHTETYRQAHHNTSHPSWRRSNEMQAHAGQESSDRGPTAEFVPDCWASQLMVLSVLLTLTC